eukprot:scaffold76373_cov41-Phaeocystis_antarctica.AAC.1
MGLTYGGGDLAAVSAAIRLLCKVSLASTHSLHVKKTAPGARRSCFTRSPIQFIDLLRPLVLGEVSEKKVLLVARQASLAELALVVVLEDLRGHKESVLLDR